MQDEIESKLKAFLSDKTTLATEPDVVYLMVELRKLLDHMSDHGDERFPVIRFYADWIVHIRKDRHSKAALALLKNLLGDMTGPGGVGTFMAFIDLSHLLQELGELLSERGLPTQFLGDGGLSVVDVPSTTLIRTLSSILNDQPLDLTKVGIGVREIRIHGINHLGIGVDVVLEDGSARPFILAMPSADQIRDMEVGGG